MKVLIVEKDNITSEILAESVTFLGFEPLIHLPTDVLALQLIETDPDIVIINRPLFLKNHQLFISSAQPNKKLHHASIVLTSNAFLSPVRIKELGGDHFLHKPFTLETLQKALETVKRDRKVSESC